MVASRLAMGLFASLLLFRSPMIHAVEMNMTKLAEADQAMERAIADGNAPGAVLLVGTRDQILYHRACGDRAIEPSRQQMTEDTIFDLASLSKPIGCATSVLILADRGKIDLGDRVSKYIPEFANHGKETITIEQLLLHWGGLIPDNPMADYQQGAQAALEKVYQLTPKWQPGTHFAYTDVGFIVLGELVRIVDGRRLDQFAKEEIFQPLGMNETSYLPPASWKPRIAPTEKRDGEGIVGEVHDPRAYALGGVAGHAGVFSTADDVAKWCQMILNGGQLNGKRILNETMVKQMLTPRTLPDGTGCRGYGVDIDTGYSSARGDRFEKRTTFGHTGFTGTSMWCDPTNGIFVVLLTNRVHPDGTGDVKQLRRQVATLAAEALLGSLAAQPQAATDAPDAAGAPADVLCGIDVLKRDNFKPLAGLNVAIITNHTGRDRDGNHIVDLLTQNPNVKVVKLFSPEHGLYGKLDEKVGHGVHEPTGLPVFSLYGDTRRPSDEMLEGVDAMVFDIQDIGARFYTYISTMGLCMEEAAKKKIKFFVLDRPNPITGTIVQGPIADKEHFGFTAYGPLPVCHGMTVGELAKLFNDEFGVKCDLTVVPVENWKRDMWWDQTGLTWINPSPNMRNTTQALLYTGVALMEGSRKLSVGRGTDQPFEYVGAPWIDGRKLASELNGQNLAGLRFVPIEFTPTSSNHKDTKCQGIYIIVTDRNAIEPVHAGLVMAWALEKLFGDAYDIETVERLLQDKATMEALKTTDDPKNLPQLWQDELEQFKTVRKKYLIYE